MIQRPMIIGNKSLKNTHTHTSNTQPHEVVKHNMQKHKKKVRKEFQMPQ